MGRQANQTSNPDSDKSWRSQIAGQTRQKSIIILFDKAKIIERIITNLTIAGVIAANEADFIRDTLNGLDTPRTLEYLLESHNIRELSVTANSPPN